MIVLLLTLAAAQDTEPVITRRIAAARGWQAEVSNWDRTRADLVGGGRVWEVDWSAKWAEGVGQSLYYSLVTGHPPGLILLVRAGDPTRHAYRAQAVCARHGITLEVYRVD